MKTFHHFSSIKKRLHYVDTDTLHHTGAVGETDELGGRDKARIERMKNGGVRINYGSNTRARLEEKF